MPTKRQPKFDQVINGTRVRVYATRSEYEVIFNDDDIADPASEVLCYPKAGLPAVWAKQGLAERCVFAKPEPDPAAVEPGEG
jgi:hypothetical protein